MLSRRVRVAVAMSGGVDSSVAALLLARAVSVVADAMLGPSYLLGFSNGATSWSHFYETLSPLQQ